ncbi:hypothetical protein CDAR_256191 [Caerostris darwini]|uniref:Uncharacterized protein n=1 Tax=Caerostris darwini TaxID=1538125 RepID=A0AAV4QZT2_9ARAC|nr:hypothetical protein CDAR_256191 [Caerostris darwini]
MSSQYFEKQIQNSLSKQFCLLSKNTFCAKRLKFVSGGGQNGRKCPPIKDRGWVVRFRIETELCIGIHSSRYFNQAGLPISRHRWQYVQRALSDLGESKVSCRPIFLLLFLLLYNPCSSDSVLEDSIYAPVIFEVLRMKIEFLELFLQTSLGTRSEEEASERMFCTKLMLFCRLHFE